MNPVDDDCDSVERCEECEADTPHSVGLEVRTENENYGGNQPYRVTCCLRCGHEADERIGMGD